MRYTLLVVFVGCSALLGCVAQHKLEHRWTEYTIEQPFEVAKRNFWKIEDKNDCTEFHQYNVLDESEDFVDIEASVFIMVGYMYEDRGRLILSRAENDKTHLKIGYWPAYEGETWWGGQSPNYRQRWLVWIRDGINDCS